MDAVSELLSDVRARGAVFQKATMRAPWGLRVDAGAPLTLATMLRGRSWIVTDDRDAVPVETGDIVVVRGDVPYAVVDDPGTAPTLVVTTADYCSPTEGVEGACGEASPTGSGSDGEGDILLSGEFERRGELSEQLLSALPPVLKVSPTDGDIAPIGLLVREVARERPGRQQMLDRLLDLMLVSVLREWFDDPIAGAPAWCRALSDPVAGGALRLMHDRPAYPWSVAELAAEMGVSRAAFAKHFTAEVGRPPMTYLAEWRITLAADLLRQTDQTVDAIARKVGYANAFALSVAFKRVRGVRPTEHRFAA